MPELRIQLTRRADGGATLRCLRADGTATWQRHEGRQAAFFPRHDLTHYALESVLGCSRGFFGLVAAGWPIEDTTGKGARGPLPAQAIVVEHLVGLIEVEGATGGEWSAAEFVEQLMLTVPGAAADAGIDVTDERLAEIRATRHALLTRWSLTPPDETLELSFPHPTAPDQAPTPHDARMTLAPPRALELSGFTMRAWSASDAPALRVALAASDAHLRRWTPWVIDGRVPGLSLEERLARHAADFADGREWVYGLFAPDGVEVLGGCGLYPRVGPRAVELGYWLAAGRTGRGLASRAAAALTRVAFAAPTIDRVEIHCDRGNAASARVPARLGYELVEPPPPGTAPELMVWCLSRARFHALEGTDPWVEIAR